MVSGRELWVKDRGKTRIVGYRSTVTEYPLRRLVCKPRDNIDPEHRVFRWLEAELEIMGYELNIDEKANIIVDLPHEDRYAVVLRKIAWAYYVALYDEPITRNQTRLSAEVLK